MPFIKIIASGATASGTTVTLTPTANTTAGGTVIIAATAGSSHICTGVTDTQSNSYAVNVSTAATARTASLARGYLTTALTTSDTITVTFGGTGQCSAAAYEFSEILKATPFDQSSSNQNTGTSVATGSTGTLANATELVVTVVGIGSSLGGAFTAPTGYTEILPSGVSGVLDAAYKYVASTSAVSATWSWAGSSQNSGTVIGTYKLKPSMFFQMF